MGVTIARTRITVNTLRLALLLVALTQNTSINTPVVGDTMNGRLPDAPTGYHWQANPALSDDFDGDQLDADKWLPYQPQWKGRVPSLFSPKNVALRDGDLRLRSTPSVKSLKDVKNVDTDAWIDSACVSSKKPIALYGYYEARIQASRLSMTSSFWLQGKYSEIDIVEQLGRSIKVPTLGQYMQMNSHYFKGGWQNDKPKPIKVRMLTGAAEKFHIYGVWWKDQDNLWFYCDGVKVAEMKTQGPFTEPMYLFLDTEAFPWAGFPTLESLNDPLKNTMYVDWVHSWTLVEG